MKQAVKTASNINAFSIDVKLGISFWRSFRFGDENVRI